MSEEEDGIKISVPLFTNLELEQFNNDNFINEITEQISKTVYHDKELIILQQTIKRLKEKLDNSIPREKVEEKIKEIMNEYKTRFIKASDEIKYSEQFVITAQNNSMRCVLEELLEDK